MDIITTLSIKDYIFLIFSFLFGGVFGSFCNVCIYRFPRGESIIRPGSRCPRCGNPIAWYDNIPLISWIILFGKCRNCKSPISIQYPIVEVLTALSFVIIFLRFRYTLATPIYCAFTMGLIIVIFQDLNTWTIPNEVTLSGIPIGVGVALLGMFFPEQGFRLDNPLSAIDGIALGALIICLLDLIVVLLVKKPGMGFGDVKLLSMLGAFLGWKGVLGSIIIASFLGSIVGLLVMGYFSLIKESTDTSSGGQSKESDNYNSYPVDIAEAIIVIVGSAYLIARTLQYYITNIEKSILPPEILRGVVLISCGFLLFAMFIAIISIYVWKKENRKEILQKENDEIEISLESHYIPFGPYLSIGGFLYLIWGPEIVSKYMQILSI